MTQPIIYSFRRCPYAMRARLAVLSAGVEVELREVVLREKPHAFLAASPSATVPCLVSREQTLDESFDIMQWALEQNDPEGWLAVPAEAYALIEEADGPFKDALDHTKYASRYPDLDTSAEREIASTFLHKLDAMLAQNAYLYGPSASIADMAILPFIRQFAFIDKAWFDVQDWPHLSTWLEAFLVSPVFSAIMPKFPQWSEGDSPILFP